MPNRELAALCVNWECHHLVIRKPITWIGEGETTVFEWGSPLVKRLAMHHDSDGTGHGQYLLFNSLADAKNTNLDFLVYAATTGLNVAYYQKIPQIIGHICVTRQRNTIGQILTERLVPPLEGKTLLP